MHSVLCFFLKGEGRRREREANIGVREKHQLVVFCARPNWTEPANLSMGPDWGQTHDLSVCGTDTNQLSHPGLGNRLSILIK